MARTRHAELRDRAERHRRASAATAHPDGSLRSRLYTLGRRKRRPAPADALILELRIRYARPDDDAALRQLAALDSSTVPDPPMLVAEVDGELHAALSLWDGRAIADPFRRTESLVELLGVRAAQIHSAAAALRQAPRAAPTWMPRSNSRRQSP
jgi:hypothetical protein